MVLPCASTDFSSDKGERRQEEFRWTLTVAIQEPRVMGLVSSGPMSWSSLRWYEPADSGVFYRIALKPRTVTPGSLGRVSPMPHRMPPGALERYVKLD